MSFPGKMSSIVYSSKKCGEPNFLTPHAFWNISNFGTKCEKCETINTITLVNVRVVLQITKMVSPIINVNSACNYPEINKLIN
jgi:hypothetical protein